MTKYHEIEVPDQILRDIRLYFGDMPEFNRLIEGTEISDEKLRLAIRLWVSHYNKTPPILSEQKVEDFEDPLIMFHGVIIELLKMAGIVHSRNFLNFNDNGVQFSVNDKAGEYLQWINQFLQTHAQDVKDLKVALNSDEAYEFHPSPEGIFVDIY